MAGNKLLRIYMNDHLAAATAAVEVSKRVAASNRSTELGTFLERCVTEFKEEARFLEGTIEGLGHRVAGHKKAAGWIAEKAGRLKLNGRLVGYSPLSRVVELEGLALLNRSNLSLWRRLREDADLGSDVQVLDGFIQRARERSGTIDRHLSEAGKIAFTESKN